MTARYASTNFAKPFVHIATAHIQRHLPYVSNMGTAISVMLLSDAVQGRLHSTSVAARALCTQGQEARPVLLMEQRPQDGVEPNTTSYPAAGYFTGIKSSVIVAQPCSKVYDSLASDLHLLFGSIEECKDKLQTDDGRGHQVLHRFVRIPFTLSYYSSALKMTLEVENDQPSGKILFKSLSQGRFLSNFVASFTITPITDRNGVQNSLVELDSRIVVKKLPPPPLKGLVKGVVVRKMDRCMRDLAEFHAGGPKVKTAPQIANNIQPSGALQRHLNTQRREERPSLL